MSESAPEKPEPSPYEKMQALAAHVMSVPKAEVDKRENKWREERAKAKKKRSSQD